MRLLNFALVVAFFAAPIVAKAEPRLVPVGSLIALGTGASASERELALLMMHFFPEVSGVGLRTPFFELVGNGSDAAADTKVSLASDLRELSSGFGPRKKWPIRLESLLVNCTRVSSNLARRFEQNKPPRLFRPMQDGSPDPYTDQIRLQLIEEIASVRPLPAGLKSVQICIVLPFGDPFRLADMTENQVVLSEFFETVALDHQTTDQGQDKILTQTLIAQTGPSGANTQIARIELTRMENQEAIVLWFATVISFEFETLG